VRCIACELEPLTAAQYCECCGGRISLHEPGALKTVPVSGPDHRTTDDGPGFDADAAAVEESLWSQLMKSSAPPAMDSFQMAHPADVAVLPPALPDVTMAPAYAKGPGATAEAVMAEGARASEARAAVLRAEAVRTEALRTETARTIAAKTHAAVSQSTRTESASVPRAPRPPTVDKRPHVPVPSENRGHGLALVMAVAVVAAIGVGAYWLRSHEQPASAGVEEQTLAAVTVTEAEREPSARRLPAAATTATNGRKSAEASPKTPASVRPKPAASAPRSSTSNSVPRPATESPAAAPVAPTVVPTAIPAAPPAPPLGPFFETTDVNESPRIATRVEPQLPDELRTRPLNEIVIVRVLVSQGGHPSRISLLRRSKTGVRLDNAVIAALNQWTFSPARKRGEPVSCWFNFGVPVGRSD